MSLRRVKNKIETVIVAGMTSEKIINQRGRLYAGTSGLCARQTTLQANFVGTEIQQPETTGYYASGNAIEEVVLDALAKQNTLLYSGYKIPECGINLGGKVDGFVRLPDETIKGIEIKSCGATLPSHPKLEHKAQALLYSAITGFPFEIIYFSRSIVDKDQNINLRSFELDSNWLDRYMTLYQAVLGYICQQNGVMPNIPTHIQSSNDCGFCRFKDICWNNQKSFMPSINTMSLAVQNDIYRESEELASELLSEEIVAIRRKSVLKYMSEYGTPFAKTLLKSQDWSDLVLTI
jgi:hypothetical protein